MADIFFGGGLNENDDLNISIEECFEGQNFVLDARGKNFKPRRPFDLRGTTPNAGQISSIMQLVKRDDTKTQLVTSGNKVYDWNGVSSFTEVATVVTATRLRETYWSLDDRLVITDLDLNTTLRQWDGADFVQNKHGIGNGTTVTATGFSSTTTVLSITKTAHGFSEGDLVTISGLTPAAWNIEHRINNVAADTFDCTLSAATTTATGAALYEASVDLYAKYSIVFQNRVWLFNIKTGADENPHVILASKFEDPDNFDNSQVVTSSGITGDEAFFITTPDLRPINGVAHFFGTLLISTTNGELYKLTGTDATNYAIEEFFPNSGASGTEGIENTGNDVIYMRQDGSIDAVSSVERFGDISVDDVSRWIPKTLDGVSSSIVRYDQKRQLIYFFVSGAVLVLDKQMLLLRPDVSPWSVYKTDDSSSFNTLVASYMQKTDGTYDVFWGDSTGRIFNMYGTEGGGDAGSTSITTRRKTRVISEVPTKHRNITGRLEYRRKGQTNMDVIIEYGESFSTSVNTVTLRERADSNPYFGGDFYFGGDNYFNDTETGQSDDIVSTLGFSPHGKGNLFFIELKATTKSNFLVNRIMI